MQYLLISPLRSLIAWLISPQVLISLMLLEEPAWSICRLLQPALAKCSEPAPAGGAAPGEEMVIWEFPLPFLLQLSVIPLRIHVTRMWGTLLETSDGTKARALF